MPVNIARLSQVLNQAADRSRVAHAMQHTHWLVYGAGRAGHQWATALSHAGRTIHGFLDNRVTTSHLAPVFPPANCPNTLREQCAVLLALHNPSVDVAAVRRNLHAAGHKYVWLLTDLIDAFPQLSHFWLAPAEETLQYAEAITTGFNALADDTSRELLLSTLDQRLNSHTDNLPTPSPSTQYCPVDIPTPRRLRYIDCGAYTGDTISSLSRHGLSFDAIAAFEPNPALYPQLCEAASQYNACLFPCGVWSEMTQLRFSPDDAASYFDDTGSVMVQTVTLDQALLNFAPNLIKMDIEGAESAALQGARQLIATYRPHLAISAYHKPRDLWELLLQVQHLDLGYQFRLRTHAHNGFDTVLYATPKP